MARGRMISNAITQDKRINQLMNDTSRLAYTWLITFADCEGRTFGDPLIVRSMLFPRREDITVAQMGSYIRQWADLGLIIWYEAKDDMWIYFPSFSDHNKVNKDREAPSKIPEPPELLMSNSGVTHDQLTVKLIKENQIEDKVIEDNASNISISQLPNASIDHMPNTVWKYASALEQSWSEWNKQVIVATGRGRSDLIEKFKPAEDADWKTIDDKTHHLKFELSRVPK